MSGKFSITGAVRNAYAFIGKEWRYLLRYSLLPVGANMLTNLFIYSQQGSISLPFGIIWNLPACAVTAWFVFIEVRLLLLGERVTALPEDPVYLENRKRCLNLCIPMFLLVYMTAMAVMGFQEWSRLRSQEMLDAVSLLALFILGVGLWAMRFAPAPILAAVDEPIAPYIKKVNGAAISLRLLGLYILSVLPLSALFALLVVILLQDIRLESLNKLPFELALLDAPLAVAIWCVLGAACCFALKEILGTAGNRKDARP